MAEVQSGEEKALHFFCGPEMGLPVLGPLLSMPSFQALVKTEPVGLLGRGLETQQPLTSSLALCFCCCYCLILTGFGRGSRWVGELERGYPSKWGRTTKAGHPREWGVAGIREL